MIIFRVIVIKNAFLNNVKNDKKLFLLKDFLIFIIQSIFYYID